LKDYYRILETSFDASATEIRSQYRFLLHAWHPDKFPSSHDKEKAQERTRLLNEAFEILSDPQKKKKYDFAYPGREKHNNRQGSPSNLVDNFEWLLNFTPGKQYSVWLDPSFNPYELAEGSTAEIERGWQDDEYQVRVQKGGKTATAAFPQTLSDILISVQLRFLPGSDWHAMAGIVFGICYTRYKLTRSYRLGLSPTGTWIFSRWDRLQGDTILSEGRSIEAAKQIAGGDSLRLIAASFEDGVQLGLTRTALSGVIRIAEPICGGVGVFVSNPENATFSGAGFSCFRPYFIKQS
jgi:hypothetical protein